MSTDLQKYSTENQLHTIRRYAEQRGFTIVRVFEDSGRSGLRMDGRDGLQSLMLEVQSGAASFQAILVYDVSRWGRFQDADEGAYHEHVCSRAGIRVHYCAEQFDNDGSIGSILLKNVKRVMAGEYSRELSVKVFAGQCHLIEEGFSRTNGDRTLEANLGNALYDLVKIARSQRSAVDNARCLRCGQSAPSYML